MAKTNEKTLLTKKEQAKKVSESKTKKAGVATKEVKKEATKKTCAKKATPKSTEKKVTTKKIENIKTKDIKRDKKVLFVVSECHPFCATGGLADVAGGLPKSIVQSSNYDVRVILPMYSNIPEKYRKDFKFVGNQDIKLSWRNIYCGIFIYELNGVIYYFIDNEQYFKREGIYSYYDDGERFAFMSKAVLDVLPIIDFKPDIIHCNDWQSALIPVYLKTSYKYSEYYKNIKTIFTLHNTEYQGKFDKNAITDVFGINNSYTNLLEYNNGLNLVKGAICCCDKFTTVSPTYAQEILGPEHSNGLDAILREHKDKISGILNGVDYEFYNPKTDKTIYKNYDVKTFKDKEINKLELQKEYGLNVNKEIPVMSIVSRMAKHKGLDLIKYCIENVLQNRDVQLMVVGNGEQEYENFFKYLESKYPGKVKAALGYSNLVARKAYAGSDIFLMPSLSEPCGISQMIASRYGAIPIVRETGGLKCSIKDFGCQEQGNGYTFANYNADDLAYSINRALNDYQDKASWNEKVKICMNKDFSWNSSAKEYISLYNQILN